MKLSCLPGPSLKSTDLHETLLLEFNDPWGMLWGDLEQEGNRQKLLLETGSNPLVHSNTQF